MGAGDGVALPAVPQPDPGIFRRPVDGREGLPGGLVPGTNSEEERAAASGCFPRGLGNANREVPPLEVPSAGDVGAVAVAPVEPEPSAAGGRGRGPWEERGSDSVRGSVASGPSVLCDAPMVSARCETGNCWVPEPNRSGECSRLRRRGWNPPARGRGPWRLPGDPRRPRKMQADARVSC